MADGPGSGASLSIAALPSTTVRQIGSHQLLTDPGSVVKELIDNALDARAKGVFVDITANTIDSIQVKDDGHGIPSEDRALACRRYCTSKIRDLVDLKEVGGKWLGFRGEALASIVDMSGTVLITTRVEGEPVAVKLTYRPNGELATTERESHPVGTTVKITKLLEKARVRKALAIKGAAKCLAGIRRLMHAYALARPNVRFRLRILKAKSDKGDFVYAPKTNANVEDATLKSIGKECALQCDSSTLESGGFELHGFMPKPNAIGTKIANYGAFISVDFRPVSSARGTLKKIAAAVKERLRKADSALAAIKDPFFYLNITCPADSYDPNIEPAKDDVMFGDEKFVLALVDRLLSSYYPENISLTKSVEDSEDAVVTQPDLMHDVVEPLARSHTTFSVHADYPTKDTQVLGSGPHSQQLRWRSSMYEIDEEDLQYLPRNTSNIVEEEEVRSDPTISNPWTIARLNATIRPRKPASNGNLPSPAKGQSDISPSIQSPIPQFTPRQPRPVGLATPMTSPLAITNTTRLEEELQQSIQPLLGPESSDISASQPSYLNPVCTRGLPLLEDRMPPALLFPESLLSPSRSSVPDSSPTRRKTQLKSTLRNSPFVPPASQADDTWFGQPMRNAPSPARSQKRPRQQIGSYFPKDNTLASQRSLVLPAAKMFETNPAPENNTSTRDLFNRRRQPAAATTPPSHQIAEEASLHRPNSADSYHHSAQEMAALFQLHQHPAPDPDSSLTRSTRRRTTETRLHRTKSASLPLNFTPRGFETHSLTLEMVMSVTSIVQQARRLDMGTNTPEWGCDSHDTFGVFATPIGEQAMMQWVLRVDALLGRVFERKDGVEVIGALHEGMQRGFDTRREETASAVVDAIARSGEGSVNVGSIAECDAGCGVGEVGMAQSGSEEGEDEMLMDH